MLPLPSVLPPSVSAVPGLALLPGCWTLPSQWTCRLAASAPPDRSPYLSPRLQSPVPTAAHVASFQAAARASGTSGTSTVACGHGPRSFSPLSSSSRAGPRVSPQPDWLCLQMMLVTQLFVSRNAGGIAVPFSGSAAFSGSHSAWRGSSWAVLGDSCVAAQWPVRGIWEGGPCVGSHSPSVTVTPHEMVRFFQVPSTPLADFLEFAVPEA